MKVRFGNFTLCDGATEGTSGLALNGQQINSRADFYRALSAVFFARGGRSASLTFLANRVFNSLRETERFVLEHFSSLPQQDDLWIYIGTEADGEWVLFAGAVIDGCSTSYRGVSAFPQYAFSVTVPLFDEPPPTVTEPDDEMIKRGETPIGSGEDTVDVEFSTPFAGTPVIMSVHVEVPAGGDKIWAHVVATSISNAGFSVELTAATPGSGYKLAWAAMA
jgi:hypothetical protein